MATKESITIQASDGFNLLANVFEPEYFNGRIVIINSATGVKQKYYWDFATFLQQNGFCVFTYDYRGIGESKPESLKGFEASMSDWGMLDFDAVLSCVLKRYSNPDITVIGHSVGGQIVGFSPLSANVRRIVMVAAQTPYTKNYPGIFQTLKLFSFWNVMIPVFTKAYGYFPASKLKLFEDLPAGVALQWARWARSRNYAFDEFPYLRVGFSSLSKQSLMVSFTDDDFAPPKAVKELIGTYSNLKWQHWEFKPDDLGVKHLGHFNFFKSKMKDQLWTKTLSWVRSN